MVVMHPLHINHCIVNVHNTRHTPIAACGGYVSSVLTRSVSKGNVPFGLLMFPLWSV